MRPLRIGIVGLGVISKFYLAALDRLPGLTLAAVCDLRADALAAQLGRVPCHSDHQVMFEQEKLDAVVVTTPNDTHAAVVRDALGAGLPVCVEKPLTVSLAEGRALDRLAGSLGVPLYTAFHRRHNDNVLALRAELRDRPPIVSVVARYFERIEEHVGTDTWYLDTARCGGGCLADNGPNAFDLIRLFLGDVRITAVKIDRDSVGIDRQATIDLESEQANGRVELDWSYPGERKDLELRLADGSALRGDLLRGHPGFKNSLWHEYLGILGEFAETVRWRDITGTNDGLAALELVHSAYQLEHTLDPIGGEL